MFAQPAQLAVGRTWAENDGRSPTIALADLLIKLILSYDFKY